MFRRSPLEAKGPITVAFPFIGDAVGGSHISALNLIKHVDPARVQPQVLIDIGDGPVAELFARENMPFEVMSNATLAEHRETGPTARKADLLRHGYGSVRRLMRHLRESGTSILHSNDGRMHVFSAIASRLTGARHVWHHRSDPEAFGLRWISPIGADHLVTVSRFAGPKPGWWSAVNKWTVVPSPFPTEIDPPDRAHCRRQMIAALGCDEQALVVGFFGNLAEPRVAARKRALDHVRAIAAYRANYPDAPIAAPIFGKASEQSQKEIKDLSEALGITDCVRLMGFRYPAMDWLAGCDVHFVPAVREPFGRTLIEAMIVGTVVVAVDDGGNPEAIEDGRNGYLVPVEDANAAAERFALIASEPAAANALAAAARREALERYGMQRHADAIMDIYERLLRRGEAAAGDRARQLEASGSCPDAQA